MQVCEETLITGTALVSGMGCGRPVFVHQEWFHENKRGDPFESVEKEMGRFQASLEAISDHLGKLHEDFDREQLCEEADIVATQLALLREGTISREIQEKIARTSCTVEKAVASVKQEIRGRFSHNANQSARTFELIEDIFVRILSETQACRLTTCPSIILPHKSVLVAEVLLPSRATELLQQGFVAIVTKRGGLMSHSALLARSKGIPFVTNILQKDWETVWSAKRILVDGFKGTVCINPSRSMVQRIQRTQKEPSPILLNSEERGTEQSVDAPLMTKDGVPISLLASIEYCGTLEQRDMQAVDGIGLYRSEYLVQELGYLPHEETQTAAFRQLIERSGHKAVTIRVFDFSGDKQWIAFDKSQAPFQGHLRSLSELISSPSIFFPHIRAIVRAAFFGNVSILFPMISSLQEFRHCRKIVEAARLSLAREYQIMPTIKIGAMVELPSIICQIPELLQEVDFIALGTNDLVQYCLAISRLGEKSCDRSSYLHEGFLFLLQYIADSCREAQKECLVCGELVTDACMQLLLLGLGFTSFTLPLALTSEAREAFSRMNVQDAKSLLQKLLTLASAKERFHCLEEWKHTYGSR